VLRLKYERIRRELSQTIVAGLTNIYQPRLSAYERGVKRPTPAQLQRLSDTFNVPPDELLKDDVGEVQP
jgi:transcriptional regulator with XRE-family HTH domain